jgi:dimethylargininase
MPDSVFIEDTALVLDELAVITRPGAESRRAETAAVAEAVRRHRPVAAILAPGTLDGGDVLRIGKRLFVGSGYRSNDAGIRQLRSIVSSQGYSVDAVPFEGCLHLKSAVSIIADDLLLINPAWVDANRFGPIPIIEVDPTEPFAANAVRVGESLVYPAEHTRTLKRLQDAGLDVRPVRDVLLSAVERFVAQWCPRSGQIRNRRRAACRHSERRRGIAVVPIEGSALGNWGQTRITSFCLRRRAQTR